MKQLYSIKLLFFFISIFSICKEVNASPIFLKVNDVEFGELLPTSGRCQMDATTGAISDVASSNICSHTVSGTPATYRLFGVPNTLYEFRVNQLISAGENGFSFTPQGVVVSDAESKPTVTGSYVSVDSGTTGIVDVKVGGVFSILYTANLEGGTDYLVEDVISVEWRLDN